MTDTNQRTPRGGPVQQFLEKFYGRVFRAIAWLGLPPPFIIVLEVRGRRSGRVQSVVLVTGHHQAERYLVSVVGDETDWVRNVRAAGEAVIRHGRRKKVRLDEVPVDQRAPILKAYLKWAFGARAVLQLGPNSPIEEFQRIAPLHPVFRIVDSGTS
jgi:hypothetical protein